MILRLWHGLRLLPMVGSEVSVQRTGARWRAQLRGVSEMFKPCSRESERQKRASAPLARRFKTDQLGPAHGRLVESDCPYGAEPRPCPGLLGWNLSSVISLHFWEG